MKLNEKNYLRNMPNEIFESSLDDLAYDLSKVNYITKYSDEILFQDWEKLKEFKTNTNFINSRSRLGVKLCEHFFPNFYDIKNSKGISFKDKWNKDDLKKVIRWNRKVHSTPYLSEFKRGVYFCNSLPKSTMFRPQIAKIICERNNIKTLFDPCAGWGGRLLGTVAYGANYIGFEPNTETYKHLKDLVKFLSIEDKVLLINDSILNYEKYNIPYYDIILTSPPYFNLEIYTNEESQSIHLNDTYDKWLINFIEPMIKLSLSKLNKNGLSCWNVADVGKYKLTEDIATIHKKFNFIKSNEYFVQSSKRLTAKTKENKNKDLTIEYRLCNSMEE